jgi:hypothetical protein
LFGESFSFGMEILLTLKGSLLNYFSLLAQKVNFFSRRKWLVDNFDMEALLYTSRAAGMIDRVQKVPIFWEIINVDKQVCRTHFPFRTIRVGDLVTRLV